MDKNIRYFNGMTEDKAIRKFARKYFKQSPARARLSLLEESRIGDTERNYDAFTEYGFLPEKYNSWSDEDIEDLIEDMREHVTGPYDCTGQRFTMWIRWHRNPGGRISVVHRFGIDV